MRVIDKNLLINYLNQSTSRIIPEHSINLFFKSYGYEHDRDIKIEEDQKDKNEEK